MMSINGYGFRSNVSNAISIYQNSPQAAGNGSPSRLSDSPSDLFSSHKQSFSPEQSFSNSMEFYGERQLAIIKTEEENAPGSSMNVEESEGPVEIKTEPGLESQKKLLSIKTVRERIRLINPDYDPEQELGVENCLPCVISFYNWILSGSAYPEAVDPKAKPLHEHMCPINDRACLLQDPLLENLHNPKKVNELDGEGKLKEYTCLTTDLPLTFKSVALKGLKKEIINNVAWQQYEKGGETFKLGILFLNHRDDDAKAHFLAFEYRETKKTHRKSKAGYALYITDPQSGKVFTFDQFLKDYRYSYADEIKMWSGQNQINYNCNKTVKEMFDSIKKEEDENLNQSNEVARSVDGIADKTKLKIKHKKRNNEQTLEPEISKKHKRDIDGEQTTSDNRLNHSENNSWARIAAMIEVKPPNDENARDVDRPDEAVPKTTKTPSRVPFQMVGSMQDRFSEDSADFSSDSITELELLDNDDDIDGRVNCSAVTDEIWNDEGGISKEVMSKFQHLDHFAFQDQLLNSNFSADSIFNQASDFDFQEIIPGKHGEVNPVEHTPDTGSAEDNFGLGVRYFFGEGVEKDLYKAYTYWKLAADQGHVKAQSNLGRMYFLGKGVPQDLNLAYTYFKLAADQGFARAQCNLGLMYLEGKGVQQDLNLAYTYSKLAADQGLAQAQCDLGLMYFYGKGVLQDLKLAYKYFKLAAGQGDAYAQSNLGKMYFHGNGVQQDDKLAYTYWKLAADQGHAESQCDLGLMYFYGKGVLQDLKLAYKYLKLAAGQGDAYAQSNLGYLYIKGKGVQQDLKLAYTYWKLAADQGLASAQCNLGKMFYGKGVQQDFKLAYTYWKLAADQGEAQAQSNLGGMYFEGIGVQPDLKSAYTYWKLAADQGLPVAQECLKKHFNGQYGNLNQTPKNQLLPLHTSNVTAPMKASPPSRIIASGPYAGNFVRQQNEEFNSLKRAADQGDAMAQYNLGSMFFEGKGVLQGYELAYTYWKLAADQGFARAQCDLGTMYLEGKGVKQDLNLAYTYWKLAADQGEAPAQCNLGLMYFEGKGVQQDLKLAYTYWKLAADLGHAGARANLKKHFNI